ncbi:unnamed protein product, partial [Symbiodinium pilosum]
ETYLLQVKGRMYDSSFVSILIPDSRPLPGLPLVALHTHAHFPELRIQLTYSAYSEEFVKSHRVFRALLENGILVLTALPTPYFDMKHMTLSTYSQMLESKEFWQATLTRKVLLVQADACLCNGARDRLQQFLQYDYVGAPFPLGTEGPCKGAGNGGFSVRDSAAMQRAIEVRGKSQDSFQRAFEDRFFCAQSDLFAVAPRAVSMEFSRTQRLSDEAHYKGSIDRIVGGGFRLRF